MPRSRRATARESKLAVIHASTRSVVRKPRGQRKIGHMPRFAKRIEKVLHANTAIPNRRSDRSLIGDLAHLDWRLVLLERALVRFVSLPKHRPHSPVFETRLMELVSEVESMAEVCADLKEPAERLLKRKCGHAGLASASLRGASTILQGFD